MSDIETQYNFDQNTIVIHIQLLPKTDANQPRTAVVGVGIKNSPPIITNTNVEQLELPAQINSMLSKLSAELPQRKAAALELMEKQQTEELQQNYLQRKVASPPTISFTQTNTNTNQKHQLTLF